MRTFKILTAFTLGLSLAGCATIVSGQTQKVTLLTPGANEAQCTLDNGVRYSVGTGQTITIMRNDKPIKIECYAPGNRFRAFDIESDGNKWAVANVVNGIIPGLTFDHFSKGLYEYPEIITVDFVGQPTIGYELPEYHNKDAPNPYDQAIEYYGPSSPKLPSDNDFIRNDVTKRGGENANNPFSTAAPEPAASGNPITPMPSSSVAVPQQISPNYRTPAGAMPTPAVPAPSVPRGSNAEALTRSMNPTVFDNQ